jgi:hypothetical protein
MSEWIENCSVNERCKCFIILYDIRVDAVEVDWGLFGQVFRAGISVLNEIGGFVFDLINVDGEHLYPDFGSDGIADSEYVFYAIIRPFLIPLIFQFCL